MHNLFLVYFVNLYMFRPYLGPSSGGTTVCIQQLGIIVLIRWQFIVLIEFQTNPITDSHLKRTIRTSCCIHTVVPPDDGTRYARNMYRLTKYAKNKLCIKLDFLYTRTYIKNFSWSILSLKAQLPVNIRSLPLVVRICCTRLIFVQLRNKQEVDCCSHYVCPC